MPFKPGACAYVLACFGNSGSWRTSPRVALGNVHVNNAIASTAGFQYMRKKLCFLLQPRGRGRRRGCRSLSPGPSKPDEVLTKRRALKHINTRILQNMIFWYPPNIRPWNQNVRPLYVNVVFWALKFLQRTCQLFEPLCFASCHQVSDAGHANLPRVCPTRFELEDQKTSPAQLSECLSLSLSLIVSSQLLEYLLATWVREPSPSRLRDGRKSQAVGETGHAMLAGSLSMARRVRNRT